MNEARKQPLSGLKVLDFTTLLPGPLATLMLAEAGATVIKVERPGTGEEMRGYLPRRGDESIAFALLNRGKQSLAVDLKSARGRDTILELIPQVDVVVEQFRPGVMDRLGLGYAALSVVNPRLVYCAISGYGQTGPLAGRAGHDMNYIGHAGLLAASMGEPGNRVVPPALVADIAGGTYPAVLNILLALRQRDLTGQGAFLDIAMTENVLPFLFNALGDGLATGRYPRNGRGLLTGGSPRYRLYDCADGRVAAVACLEQKFWEAFCAAIDLPEPLRDDRSDPRATIGGIASILVSKPSSHWEPVFAAADCCCSIVQELEAAMADPHLKARGVFDFRLAQDGVPDIPALPLPVDRAFRGDPAIAVAAPRLNPET
jgi:crotonobetainyl-CoA:carnitine CoA-transferase CaiB-like acyl-CoA transferase